MILADDFNQSDFAFNYTQDQGCQVCVIKRAQLLFKTQPIMAKTNQSSFGG